MGEMNAIGRMELKSKLLELAKSKTEFFPGESDNRIMYDFIDRLGIVIGNGTSPFVLPEGVAEEAVKVTRDSLGLSYEDRRKYLNRFSELFDFSSKCRFDSRVKSLTY
jgi:hypothetical protein|tara:strand:- start:16 stop:339 length:324 start_codon:yes stop_codon:yes gene_type:complete